MKKVHIYISFILLQKIHVRHVHFQCVCIFLNIESLVFMRIMVNPMVPPIKKKEKKNWFILSLIICSLFILLFSRYV